MGVIKLNELGQKIFEQRYALPGETSWKERARCVARHIASAESDETRESTESKFFDIISTGDFVPGGRILFGSGRSNYNLLNCYVLSPQDDVNSIGKVISDMYKISCGGGGIGFNFSNIRPRGDDIQTIKHSAPGSVSVMKMINEIGNHVRAGKNRRTALMGILNITHPDLLEFLHVKLDNKELTNFNISVAITDRFIEACKNEEEWYFTFSNKKYYVYSMVKVSPNGERKDINCVGTSEEDAIERAKNHLLENPDDKLENVEKYPLSAKELWNKIWRSAVQSGDPGIYNISLANEYTNVSYFEELPSTNPCGEIPLPAYGNCCLGHINLANMVEETGEFNWKRFATVIRAGVRFLDNVLTVNHFPIPECKDVGHKSRRIGLGVMGYHYMLIKLGLKYGSEKCLEFTERLAQTLRDEAYKSSAYLAREKGCFPAYNAKKFLSEGFAKTLSARIRFIINTNGIRNAVLLTIAPTGTISMVMGVSSGIEPIFAAMYKRRYREGSSWRETVVMDPLFKEYLDSGKLVDNFVGAYDVSPEAHMAVQAVWQKYIDNSISKTINLPKDFTLENSLVDKKLLEDVALDYASYLKGLTIYRAGSKGNEPLEAIPLTRENINKYAAANSAIADGFCKTNGECG